MTEASREDRERPETADSTAPGNDSADGLSLAPKAGEQGSCNGWIGADSRLSNLDQTSRSRAAKLASVRWRLIAAQSRSRSQGDAMSFGLYSIGFAVVIAGLIYAAHLMHVPAQWIAVGAIVLIGVGILKGVKTTRQKDPMGQ